MVTIRIATKLDLPQILSIYKPYVENTAVSFEYKTPTLKDFTKRFEEITKQFAWVVCEIDGEIAGYAYASKAFERKAYQWNADISVYINEQYHRKGIASAFYKCIEGFLQLQGYCNVYALVTGENIASITFHKAIGYKSFAVFNKAGYKLGKWLDVIWLEKNINNFADNPKPPVAFLALNEEAVKPILVDSIKLIK